MALLPLFLGAPAATRCEPRGAFGARATTTDTDEAAPSRSDLVQAARAGDVPTVFRLLPQLLDSINEPLTPIGEPVLAVACAAGALPLVAKLLESGADPSVKDRRGGTCLLVACEAGQAHVAKRLLNQGTAGEAEPDIYGLAPIHKAVAFGHTEVLRTLLEHGIDPNVPTSDVTAPEEYGSVSSRHETALHIAVRVLARDVSDARSRCYEIVELLLRYSADPLSKDMRGDTPLHFCARRGDFTGLWLLLGNTSDATVAVASSNDAGVNVLSEVDAAAAPLTGAAVRAAMWLHPLRRRWQRYWSIYAFVGRVA